MIYDVPISILKLPDNVGTPLQAKLVKHFDGFCGEKEVYYKRFWDAVQAGSRIDVMVELPFYRDVEPGMFAQYKQHVYSIEQAQFGKDENQLPITTLSLKRSEVQYDIAAV